MSIGTVSLYILDMASPYYIADDSYLWVKNSDILIQQANSLERVNNLIQSILAKAFRGELIAQWCAENPDYIHGENSAEALLIRIKKERLKSKPVKRGKGNSWCDYFP